MKTSRKRGALYALLAAILNSTVGIFSLVTFASDLSAESVAFYKCLAAFIFLTLIMIVSPKQRRMCFALRKDSIKIALMSFFGVFMLYFFETASYHYNQVAVVVFVLLAASTLTTLFASRWLLQHEMNAYLWMSITMALIGLFLFTLSSNTALSANLGVLFSAIAGVGYGIFLVLNKKFNLPFAGFGLLWWLLLYGCIFLSIPFLSQSHSLPPVTASGLLYLTLLGILPTIGGFYCTTKALLLTDALHVQLFELTEPIFASILALIIFTQKLSFMECIAGLFILLAIGFSGRG